IARTTGSWIADGFVAGSYVALGGGTLAGTYLVSGVTALTLTWAGASLTPATGVAGTVTPSNADGQPLDGAVLLVDNGTGLGSGALSAGQLNGTISLANRYRVTGTITLDHSLGGVDTVTLPAG